MFYMVRTQLYLPEDLYAQIKSEAKMEGISFAEYVRINLEKREKKKKKSVVEAYPFLKFAGSFDWGKNASCNDSINEALYGNANGPL